MSMESVEETTNQTEIGGCHNCAQCSCADRGPRCRSRSRRRDRRRRRAGGASGGRSGRSSRNSRRSSGGRASRHSSRRSSPSRSTPTNTASSRSGRANGGNRRRRSGRLLPEEEATQSQITQWPQKFSFFFGMISTMFGVFTMDRIAVLTGDFGVPFLLQYLLLSLCFGVPMLLLFICVGHYLGSGLIDMWRISPIFQGIGISLMLVQGFVGAYSTMMVSYLFTFLRDTTKFYIWGNCPRLESYREVRKCPSWDPSISNKSQLASVAHFTVPDYVMSTVLSRESPVFPESFMSPPRFQVAFNLIFAWLIIYLANIKGVKSYGWGLPVFAFVGFLCYVITTIQLWDMRHHLQHFQKWLSEENWANFISNKQSWLAAARECFLSWCLLGGTMIQQASMNQFNRRIKKPVVVLILISFLLHILAGMVGFITDKAIKSRIPWAVSTPSSFETYKTSPYLSVGREASSTLPMDTYKHVTLFAGMRILHPAFNPGSTYNASGFQILRFAMERFPTFCVAEGENRLGEPFPALFYLCMTLFALSQAMSTIFTFIQGLIAIKPSLLKKHEILIATVVCVCGYFISLPLTTETGIFMIYFLDLTIGSSWWIMVLYLILIFAIFIVRGKPYSPDQVIKVLLPDRSCCGAWLAPLLAFTWSVVLPIALLVLAVVSFKSGFDGEMFDWRMDKGYVYLPSWTREIGAMLQLLPLLTVPFVGIVQTCRYFLQSNKDLFTRLELLYRPSFSENTNSTSNSTNNTSRSSDVVLTNFTQTAPSGGRSEPREVATGGRSDPPPKYTPPPSYSTATGARLARILRQSFRQSMRRLQDLGAAASATVNQTVITATVHPTGKPDPPGYSAGSPPDYDFAVRGSEMTLGDLQRHQEEILGGHAYGVDASSRGHHVRMPSAEPVFLSPTSFAPHVNDGYFSADLEIGESPLYLEPRDSLRTSDLMPTDPLRPGQLVMRNQESAQLELGLPSLERRPITVSSSAATSGGILPSLLSSAATSSHQQQQSRSVFQSQPTTVWTVMAAEAKQQPPPQSAHAGLRHTRSLKLDINDAGGSSGQHFRQLSQPEQRAAVNASGHVSVPLSLSGGISAKDPTLSTAHSSGYGGQHASYDQSTVSVTTRGQDKRPTAEDNLGLEYRENFDTIEPCGCESGDEQSEADLSTEDESVITTTTLVMDQSQSLGASNSQLFRSHNNSISNFNQSNSSSLRSREDHDREFGELVITQNGPIDARRPQEEAINPNVTRSANGRQQLTSPADRQQVDPRGARHEDDHSRRVINIQMDISDSVI